MNIDATDLLLAATGERSVRAVALRVGYDPSTLTRQMKSGIKAETVIDVARAYDLPTVMLLVRFGFLTPAEADRVAADSGLKTATDEELAQEILARVRDGSATTRLTDPVVPTPPANVGGDPQDEIPHIGYVDVEALRQSGVALAADERDGIQEEQEQSQELP